MPDRTRLHELVDALPEAALAVAQGALERFQTWPPEAGPRLPEHLRELRERHMQRMRSALRPGTGGGSGGGSSYLPGPGGRAEFGHYSHSHWEGETVVIETHRFHAGHELVVEERLRLAGGGRLVYVHAATGPDGTRDRREVVFNVGK